MNIKWGVDKDVEPGPYCSAQGAIKQMSDVGSAVSTLIISLYTLRVVCFWRIGDSGRQTEPTRANIWARRKNLIRSLIIVACLWCSLGILVAINVAVDGVQRFYGPTGYWCWIQANYSIQRTATDFGFMWITAFCNIAVYGILFLYFKGYITTDGWHIRLFSEPAELFHPLMSVKQVYGLLFYPIAYTVTVLPLSIARYRTFAHHEVPLRLNYRRLHLSFQWLAQCHPFLPYASLSTPA
ncbi:hypothetical protein BJV77DRAFT_531342 [Russula vinacea]|nr:hypothetical protein BJV77DRAFT_531342 [Russula vinacea]